MRALFFTTGGRLNRARFWLGHLIVAAVFMGVCLVCAGLAVLPQAIDGGHDTVVNVVAFGLIGILALVSFVLIVWAGLCLGIKRYHDRDKSGAWVLIQFAPFIGGIWYFIEAGCLAGTIGANAYGRDLLNPHLDAPAVSGPYPAPGSQIGGDDAQRGRPGWVLPVMLALTLPGAAILAVGVGMALHTMSWLKTAERIDGTVVALKPAGTDENGHALSKAIVGATTKDGTPMKITDGWATYPGWEIGSKVSLVYPPGHPDEAMIAGFLNLWFFPALLGGIGGAIVITWLFITLLIACLWKRAPRASTGSVGR